MRAGDSPPPSRRLRRTLASCGRRVIFRGNAAARRQKKTASKAAARRPAAMKAEPASRPRLTPPPGLSATEFLKRLPLPAKDFDAEGVERIVALRASR